MELNESVSGGRTFAEVSVDRESNMIHDITLLGRVSKNGRRYSTKAMEDAVRLYEGVRFFLNHPTAQELRDRKGSRSVLDLAGRIRRPRLVGDRVRGDLEVLSAEPGRSLLFSIAEQMPDLVGASHRASGKVRREGREEIVTELDSVAAVELVTNPATVGGLFESIQEEKMKQTKEIDLVELYEDKIFRRSNSGPDLSATAIEEAAGKVFIGGAGASREVGEDEFEDVVNRVFR